MDFTKEEKKIIQRWYTIRNISTNTREVYTTYIKQFLKQSNTTLEEILDTTRKQIKNDTPPEEMTLYNQILDYKYELDNSKYAETTKKLKMQVIFSFCKAYKLPRPEIRQPKVICQDKNYEKPLTKKQLQQMMNSNGLRERAFISLQSMTGMSSKEARGLTIRKLLDCINNNNNTEYNKLQDLKNNQEEILQKEVYQIKIVREKVNYRYITFIPTTTMKHILDYINYRINTTGKKQLKNINDYIFITKNGKYMNSKAVTGMYKLIGEKAGFTSEDNTYRYWRSHNCRKYFYNIVEDIVGQEYADEFLGHVPSKTTQAYARREYRMKTAYMKCLPYLLYENNDYEINKLQEEIMDLEDTIQKLKKKMDK